LKISKNLYKYQKFKTRAAGQPVEDVNFKGILRQNTIQLYFRGSFSTNLPSVFLFLNYFEQFFLKHTNQQYNMPKKTRKG
jgi:hypothetical protein